MKPSLWRFVSARSGVSALAAAVLITATGLLPTLGPRPAGAAPLGTITEFSAGLNPGSAPWSIVAGPDGNLWFTDDGTTRAIGRITPSGAITEFSTGLNAGSAPKSVVAGSDGNLWFTDDGSTRALGRVTPSGEITEFSAGLNPGSDPRTIVASPDGDLWFNDEGSTHAIGRITPSGAITEFSAGLLKPFSNPNGIVAGPDGNIWFSDFWGAIGQITPSGTITEFSTGLNPGSQPDGIITGPDGNLWFSDNGTTKAIGRITPSGAIAEFVPGLAKCTGICGVGQPVAGADGNVWFVESETVSGRIARITPSGTIATFSTGNALFAPQDLAPGPDENMWFAMIGGSEAPGPNAPRQNAIGRITPSGTIEEFASGLQPVVYGQQDSSPREFVAGPDGNVWFTDGAAIGRITTAEEASNPIPSPNPTPSGGGGVLGSQTVHVSSAQIAALLAGELTPSGKAAKIATLLKSGGFTIVIKALEAGTAVIDWYEVPAGAKPAKKAKPKPVLVGAGQRTFPAAGTATIKIKLTTAGKSLLKHGKTLKLTAKGTFTPTGKTQVSATKVFALKH